METTGVTFVSLQVGSARSEIESADFRITDAGHLFNDFSDTAGALMHLDLVITVDTSVAHLAGALGKPVWTLIPTAPDWRWMFGRDDTPWYPTMTLYRQEVGVSWASTVERMAHDLSLHVQSRTHPNSTGASSQ